MLQTLERWRKHSGALLPDEHTLQPGPGSMPNPGCVVATRTISADELGITESSMHMILDSYYFLTVLLKRNKELI